MGGALAGLSPYAQVGIKPGPSANRPGYGSAGAALPASTVGAGVASVGVPWSPDHPIFWIVALALVTAGVLGGSFKVHAGPAAAGASLGKV